MNNEQTSADITSGLPISIEAIRAGVARFDITTGELEGGATGQRRLSQLRDCFCRQGAYSADLALGDPIIYSINGVETMTGDGQLGYGLGVLLPGKVGDEYYLTRGHLHAYRPAAELYICLAGDGMMLMENEDGSDARAVPLTANSTVYVPGDTAHRTVNVGSTPLVYFGVYPSNAGHDYGALASRNFSLVVLERDGRPVVCKRSDLANER